MASVTQSRYRASVLVPLSSCDGNGSTGSRQRRGDAETDTAISTCNDRDPAGQVEEIYKILSLLRQ
jgi:hypothetical protein